MSKPLSVDEIMTEVLSGSKYRALAPGFVERVSRQEILKERSHKETVKAVRGKLHQAGAAYQEAGIPYESLTQRLAEMGPQPSMEEWRTFSREVMKNHASTAERLPIVEEFFSISLADIGPVHSVLDLACGLNPLAFPFMPLAEDVTYLAGDIYLDMVDFLNKAFQKMPVQGQAFPLDLAAETPQQQVQVAFLLKTLPCMEQQVKDSGRRLLTELQAEHLLVSFPIASLGGRSKGMAEHYDAYLQNAIAGRPWKVKRFDFAAELAYLISK
jgi:16S rRNA (guanine(1405)-N(7))-methyltransferase